MEYTLRPLVATYSSSAIPTDQGFYGLYIAWIKKKNLQNKYFCVHSYGLS